MLLDDVLATPPAASGGYAFEAAMCLVESQSPLVRPALDDPAPHASATIEEHETHVLLSRTRMLTKLLAGVRGHLDAEEWRMLLDAAKRVAGELMAVLGPIVERIPTDPARTTADRASASAALAEARLLANGIGILADRLRAAPRLPGRSLEPAGGFGRRLS
ncbi:MAG: hypothetical protein HC900_06930 [Methylacidiphilales bacterium]|nr:hypothetical protein [Candidatus Methylacidiphilales bacterium]